MDSLPLFHTFPTKPKIMSQSFTKASLIMPMRRTQREMLLFGQPAPSSKSQSLNRMEFYDSPPPGRSEQDHVYDQHLPRNVRRLCTKPTRSHQQQELEKRCHNKHLCITPPIVAKTDHQHSSCHPPPLKIANMQQEDQTEILSIHGNNVDENIAFPVLPPLPSPAVSSPSPAGSRTAHFILKPRFSKLRDVSNCLLSDDIENLSQSLSCVDEQTSNARRLLFPSRSCYNPYRRPAARRCNDIPKRFQPASNIRIIKEADEEPALMAKVIEPKLVKPSAKRWNHDRYQDFVKQIVEDLSQCGLSKNRAYSATRRSLLSPFENVLTSATATIATERRY